MTEPAGERTVQPGRTAERIGFFTDGMVALLFGLVYGLVLASRAAIQTLAGRDDEVLQPEADRYRHRVSVVTAWAVIVYWALTLPFVWWAPWTQIPWFLTGMVGNLVGRIYRGGGWKRLRIRTS